MDDVRLVSVGGELLLSEVNGVGVGVGNELAPDIHFDKENTINK